VRRGLYSILLLILAGLAPARAASLPAGPLIMGYYESWAELPVAVAQATRLANLPAYLDIVALGFVRPDAAYDGGSSLQGTGLQVPFDVPILRQAVAALKQRNPAARVILSVGGATYTPYWKDYDPGSIARLVSVLGLDGIDLDYEPTAPLCRPGEVQGRGTMVCATDAAWGDLIRRTRAALPRPALLTVPGWSVGAYGAGAFRDDPPSSPYTGSMLWLGRIPEAREVDLVSIMAYEAGSQFDPLRSFAAYRAVWPGPLLLGVRAPAGGPQDPAASVATLERWTKAIAADPLGGLMIYASTGEAPGGATLAVPDGALAGRAICAALGRAGCPRASP